MIALKKILVTTDFSETSQSALLYAKAFAETFQASLHVVHVLEESLAYAAGSLDGAVPVPDSVLHNMQASAREMLGEMFTDAERQHYRAELVLLHGSPFVEIVRYAKTNDIDLIVMGRHGRGPIAHMLMGSVADRVVRKAPCPVLTVRHPEHEFVMP